MSHLPGQQSTQFYLPSPPNVAPFCVPPNQQTSSSMQPPHPGLSRHNVGPPPSIHQTPFCANPCKLLFRHTSIYSTCLFLQILLSILDAAYRQYAPLPSQFQIPPSGFPVPQPNPVPVSMDGNLPNQPPYPINNVAMNTWTGECNH